MKGAIFDLDGVLAPTQELHFRAWQRVFNDFLAQNFPGSPEFTLQEYLAWVDGKPRLEGVAGFLAGRGIELSPLQRQELAQLKDSFFQQELERGVKPYPGTKEFLAQLAQNGLKLALVSSSRNAARVLAASGLAAYFSVVVDGNAKLPGKPDPAAFLTAAQALGVKPDQAVIFEDSLAGVEAGRRGGFRVVVGIDRGGNRVALKEQGADWVVNSLEAVSWAGLLAWFSYTKLPSALAEFGRLKQETSGKKLGIFLDYDGTLAEIAPRPELAHLAPYQRQALASVAQVHPTFIISGRDLADIRTLVGITELYYAGSHGYQIWGPGFEYEFDPSLSPLLAQLGQGLKPLEREFPGCLVELKGYAVAVHYRLVAPDLVPQIRERLEAALAQTSGLKLAEGKKVFEIRPDRDWDKGKALEYMLELFAPHLGELYPMYIGDDTTDEDAFRAVASRGTGILVSEWPRPTLARYLLQDPFEVAELLKRLGAL